MAHVAAPHRDTHPRLDPLDLYAVDDLLGADERLLQQTVRSFVRSRVLPVIGEHFEAGSFPRELVGELAELGLLGMHLEGYGCAGASGGRLRGGLRGAGGGGQRHPLLRLGAGVAGDAPVRRFGSEEQRRRWLPEMATGRAVAASA